MENLQRVSVETHPLNAECPLPALAEPLTPLGLFYVRNHFDVPRIDRESWRLELSGEVERPLELSWEDLQALPQRAVAVTMECAGNGRTQMLPRPPGTPWGHGAAATAWFAGAPLYLLLDRARPNPEAVEALFTGADQGEVEPGRVTPFARALPLEAARHPDTLLAWSMNGEPLPLEHGFPLRLVVPRWYGVASVKWLTGITLRSSPFDGYFQRARYVYEREQGTPEGTPVTLMRVRSVVARPLDGEELPFEPVEVAGTAWSGAGPIRRVKVRVEGADRGSTRGDAELGEALSPYAATPWRFRWDPLAHGTFTLTARAYDAAGNSQPLEPLWNAHGYGNNAVQRVRVRVR